MAIEASDEYCSYPTGQDEKQAKKRIEVKECACARSIDHGALKSQEAQYAVITKALAEKLG